MHWPFLAAAVLAVAFFQLGAPSVTFTFLSIALQAALLVVALAVGAAYVWRHLRGPDRGLAVCPLNPQGTLRVP